MKSVMEKAERSYISLNGVKLKVLIVSNYFDKMSSIQVKFSLVDDGRVLFQNVSQTYKHQTSVL